MSDEEEEQLSRKNTMICYISDEDEDNDGDDEAEGLQSEWSHSDVNRPNQRQTHLHRLCCVSALALCLILLRDSYWNLLPQLPWKSNLITD